MDELSENSSNLSNTPNTPNTPSNLSTFSNPSSGLTDSPNFKQIYDSFRGSPRDRLVESENALENHLKNELKFAKSLRKKLLRFEKDRQKTYENMVNQLNRSRQISREKSLEIYEYHYQTFLVDDDTEELATMIKRAKNDLSSSILMSFGWIPATYINDYGGVA